MSNETVKNYVNDLKEAYVAKETLEKINTSLSDTKNQKSNLNQLKRKISLLEGDISSKKPATEDQTNPSGWGITIIGGIVAAILGGLAITLVVWLFTSFLSAVKIGGIGGGVIFVILILFNWPESDEDWKKRIDKLKCEIAVSEKELSDAKQELIICEKAYEDQLEYNSNAIISLEQNIQKMHQLNIVPPDYRNMACIISLDHIFRNDLADTVRDGILLYKEWAFQIEVLNQMQHMQKTLELIEKNTASLCQSMYDLVDLQQQQIKTQERILEETACTRYAAESIKRSNEKFEWYAEQQRQGLL